MAVLVLLPAPARAGRVPSHRRDRSARRFRRHGAEELLDRVRRDASAFEVAFGIVALRQRFREEPDEVIELGGRRDDDLDLVAQRRPQVPGQGRVAHAHPRRPPRRTRMGLAHRLPQRLGKRRPRLLWIEEPPAHDEATGEVEPDVAFGPVGPVLGDVHRQRHATADPLSAADDSTRHLTPWPVGSPSHHVREELHGSGSCALSHLKYPCGYPASRDGADQSR